MRPLGAKGADAPEELVENVCTQKRRAASAWSGVLAATRCRLADRNAITASLAAIAGYFTYQPPPLGIPTVRAFQAAQGAVRRKWLAERTGWS